MALNLFCMNLTNLDVKSVIKKSFDTNVNKVTTITISFKNVLKIKYLLMKKFKIRTILQDICLMVSPTLTVLP